MDMINEMSETDAALSTAIDGVLTQLPDFVTQFLDNGASKETILWAVFWRVSRLYDVNSPFLYDAQNLNLVCPRTLLSQHGSAVLQVWIENALIAKGVLPSTMLV